MIKNNNYKIWGVFVGRLTLKGSEARRLSHLVICTIFVNQKIYKLDCRKDYDNPIFNTNMVELLAFNWLHFIIMNM